MAGEKGAGLTTLVMSWWLLEAHVTLVADLKAMARICCLEKFPYE